MSVALRDHALQLQRTFHAAEQLISEWDAEGWQLLDEPLLLERDPTAELDQCEAGRQDRPRRRAWGRIRP